MNKDNCNCTFDMGSDFGFCLAVGAVCLAPFTAFLSLIIFGVLWLAVSMIADGAREVRSGIDLVSGKRQPTPQVNGKPERRVNKQGLVEIWDGRTGWNVEYPQPRGK